MMKPTPEKIAPSIDSDDDPPIYKSDQDVNEKSHLIPKGKGKQTDIYENRDGNDSELDDALESKASDSKCSRCLRILPTLTLEPFLFVYMFSFIVRSSCSTNLMIDKACLVHYNFSELICSNLSNYKTEKDLAEKLANNYSLFSTLIQMGPSAILMIFIGPWSDIYGRKPPLFYALIGSILEGAGMILNTVYFNLRLEYILLASVPTGLSGGFIAVLTVCYSCASDVSSQKMRTMKYAFLEMAFGLGMAFGPLAGGLIFKYYSYLPVFAVATSGYVLSMVWALIVVAETRGLDVTVSWKKKLCDIFSAKNLVENFKTCMKIRENNGRAQIWALVLSMCAIVLTYSSFANISYLYAHHQYDWGPTKYSAVSTVFSSVSIVVIIITIPLLTKVLKVGDPVLGLVGISSLILKNVVIAFATQPWLYYVGNALGMLTGITPLAVRARLSKIIDKNELGKVFGFLSTCESLVPVIGSMAVSQIFNATIDIFPGLCYLVPTAFLFLPFVVFIWQIRMKPKVYELLVNAPPSEVSVGHPE